MYAGDACGCCMCCLYVMLLYVLCMQMLRVLLICDVAVCVVHTDVACVVDM